MEKLEWNSTDCPNECEGGEAIHTVWLLEDGSEEHEINCQECDNIDRESAENCDECEGKEGK